MTLSIKSIRPAKDEEWDNTWERCDYATYFHSREWAMIWNKYTRGKFKPTGLLVTFSDNKTALLPFSSRSYLVGSIKQCISSPAGTFGGWLSLSELTVDHGNLLCDYILGSFPNLLWRLNAIDPLTMHMKVDNMEDDETRLLDLTEGFDTLFKRWTKGHASAVRQAQKANIAIREANSIQDWKDYFYTYETSIVRWGSTVSSVYEWSMFQIIFDLHSPRIKLWLATHQEKIIAGALCFYARNHVVYWHGAALGSHFNLRPVNLLLYEIIKNACEQGYQWFDFNPSGGHEGVEKFKNSFGTKKVGCPIVIRRNFLLQLATSVYGLIRHR